MRGRAAARAGAAGLAALLALRAPLRAQTNTAEMLQRAIHLYEQVEIEQALVILRQVISPSSPFEVSRDQRVQAYTYLGAALALEQGDAARDSAIVYFRAAIERDPFVDLDPRAFNPAQLSALAEARRRTFAAAIRPIEPETLTPRPQAITFRALTTHRAATQVELRLDGATRRLLLNAVNDGPREIPWDGFLADGSLAPEGQYELRIVAHSQLLDVTDTAAILFDLAYDHAPFHDTLPDLIAADLLPERRPASAATSDLLKGVGVAAAALLIPRLLSAPDLGAGHAALAGIVAGGGAVAGVAAFFVRRAHPEILANEEENQLRLAAHRASNAAIVRQNADILRHSRLVLTPAVGGGP